jgi:hypothetical protein
VPEQESLVMRPAGLEISGAWYHVINREHQRAAKCAMLMLRFVPDGLPVLRK